MSVCVGAAAAAGNMAATLWISRVHAAYPCKLVLMGVGKQ